ncbi:hypothetical protein [Streptomyces sp. SID13031]|uniref:hypothetical protein n=1 Tax=Streptomyces sp. SID13031 TaxID=2706046 RepID=UPI0013C98B3C|nr:hypothetical protein [Streptomyces sp. SID13031]NEA35646.1 hypothetical protein [Streptomyces sp. SID13031]
MNELPRSLKLVQRAVGVVILVHLVALILLLTHRDVIHGTVLADNPGWSADQVDDQTHSLVLQSAIPHVLIPLLLAFRAKALKSRKSRTRIFLTVLLGIQLLAHASLPITLHELPGYGAAVIAVQAVSLVFELSALWLLWATEDSRAWFVRATPVTGLPR